MQLKKLESFSSLQYTVAVRLTLDQRNAGHWQMNQQSARTCGKGSDSLESSDLELVKWNEIFFFKIDSPVSIVLYGFFTLEILLKLISTCGPNGLAHYDRLKSFL